MTDSVVVVQSPQITKVASDGPIAVSIVSAGSQGPAGPVGPPGPTGPQGPQGPAGSGVTGRLTISATEPENPLPGDVWVDIS